MAVGPRKVGEGPYRPLADINVTPPVELVLLIIFMVTAPMLAAVVKVNLPSARTAQPLENSEPAASAASLSAYIGEVSSAIRSRLFYPPAARARGAKGVVGVSFTIGSSGAESSFSIPRSSGDSDLDAATRSLVQGARFPSPRGGSAHIATSFNYVPR